ncbi:hypothetical protein C0995_002407, partial [Termitomyces sp. Mi166
MPPRMILIVLIRKNINVPASSTMIPEMAALSQPVVAKKPNSKPLQLKEGITTARNLYM